MFKTKLLVIAALLGASSVVTAQVPDSSKPSDVGVAAPATVAEITRLARELRVETLRKELREAKEAGKPPVDPAAVPAAGAPAAPKVRVIPRAPAVSAIYGLGAAALEARLVDGTVVRQGASSGIWRVVSISVSAVTFERCETIGRKKSARQECTQESVAPRG
ncbi:hypothetical protein KBW71_00320 [Hydrogenophaga aromaticivorans]|uniref:hypothetical protein n=1 Tax=Hydrogenophaga aromaticivorans TaxID=2610898 RepID=UPI001B37E25C|nr:hypothetical protein [Hydrogenophaga aromaticivorans]MBQ0916894.1 hypothetical protein [Hydrogenophaga aromaticivorans]MBU4337889.1 hypothetical protein [Actinomycetota bacterium]